MRILILGVKGQLGTDLRAAAMEAGHETDGLDLPELDITDRRAVERAVRERRPDAVLNPAAYTAVDDCERDEARAMAVNRDGARNAALAAAAAGARLVHYGTDYVFDGAAARPYVESDTPGPVTAYGRTKLAGEREVAAACPRHQILRIAWLYGAHGNNFVKTILRLARRNSIERRPLRVVDDQRGTPTWTGDVCRQTLALLGVDDCGVFHCTSEGSCTWFDFATTIVARAGIDLTVEPCTTAEYPRPARRPAFSVLENARLKSLGINLMPPWGEAFDAFWDRHGGQMLRDQGIAERH